jgi:hypothetical protein
MKPKFSLRFGWAMAGWKGQLSIYYTTRSCFCHKDTTALVFSTLVSDHREHVETATFLYYFFFFLLPSFMSEKEKEKEKEKDYPIKIQTPWWQCISFSCEASPHLVSRVLSSGSSSLLHCFVKRLFPSPAVT